MDRPKDRRQQVQRAALRLFAKHGFEATGVRAIADEVGLTPASLYNYGSKEDLLAAIMHEGLDELMAAAESVVQSSSDPREQLQGLVREHVTVHANSREAALVADSELRALGAENCKVILGRRRKYERIWRQVIQDGVESGAFHVEDAPVLRLSLLTMCTGVAHWYSPSGRLPLEKLVGNMQHLALMMAGCVQTEPVAASAES